MTRNDLILDLFISFSDYLKLTFKIKKHQVDISFYYIYRWNKFVNGVI